MSCGDTRLVVREYFDRSSPVPWSRLTVLEPGERAPGRGQLGHLVLRALDPDRSDPVRAQALDTAVANLRSMVGSEHPDVESQSSSIGGGALRSTRPRRTAAPPKSQG